MCPGRAAERERPPESWARGNRVRMDIGARTDVGRVRQNNEDSYRIVPELGLFVISDGMGGEAHGEVASQMAVELIASHCQEGRTHSWAPLAGEQRTDVSETTNRLLSAVRVANQEILNYAAQDPGRRGMGATVVAAWVEGPRMSLVHVGDSRAYLLREGSLQQLTEDHSLVAEQVRRGILTVQQAEQSQMQSVLIRALAIEEGVDADASEQVLLEGDAVVLCTDGLTRMVPDAEIASVLLTYPRAQAAADRLVEIANDYGGEDNITIAVFRILRGSDGVLARLKRKLGGAEPGGA